MTIAQTKPQLSIVVPVYNEGANVEPLAVEIRETLAGRLHYELIFVDDGSIDDTPDEVERVCGLDSTVSLSQHDVYRGQSAAVRTGVQAANADIIAVLDGDGQNDPKDIPSLYGHLTMIPSLRLVIGHRRQRKDNWLRRASSRVANSIRAGLLGDGVSDTSCGLKAFYRKEYLALPAFDHMHRFLPALVQRSGGKVYAIPVNHRARLSGTSKYDANNRLSVCIADTLGVMWLQNRRL